jgi:hypothetical protein
MSTRYPFCIHRGSFPSKIEVVTVATRDVYGTLTGPATNGSAVSALPSSVSLPVRVQRSRIEELDTQAAINTNRVNPRN